MLGTVQFQTDQDHRHRLRNGGRRLRRQGQRLGPGLHRQPLRPLHLRQVRQAEGDGDRLPHGRQWNSA